MKGREGGAHPLSDPAKEVIRPRGTVLIVGGTGRMGRWFAHLFKEMNFRVLIYSRTPETTIKVAKILGVSAGSLEDAEHSDIILVSVPTEAVAETCLRLGEKMRKGAALVEISAIKTGVEKLAEKMPNDIGFLSLHPLFGPTAKSLRKQEVAMVINKESPWTWTLLRDLEEKGAKIVIMSSQDHDKYMACIQSLHHFALLTLEYAMKDCLSETGFEGISTRSLRATLRNLRSMHRNLDTIEEIQSKNPYSKKARELFYKTVKEFTEEKPEKWINRLRKIKI